VLSTTHDARPRYTGELLLRTRPKIYRQIVRLLSEGTDDIPLNTLVPALGVSVDKLAVLRGHAPSVNIANIWMPSEEERKERRAVHKRLDEIARRLRESCEPKP
jgi:hypothetical protein